MARENLQTRQQKILEQICHKSFNLHPIKTQAALTVLVNYRNFFLVIFIFITENICHVFVRVGFPLFRRKDTKKNYLIIIWWGSRRRETWKREKAFLVERVIFVVRLRFCICIYCMYIRVCVWLGPKFVELLTNYLVLPRNMIWHVYFCRTTYFSI